MKTNFVFALTFLFSVLSNFVSSQGLAKPTNDTAPLKPVIISDTCDPAAPAGDAVKSFAGLKLFDRTDLTDPDHMASFYVRFKQGSPKSVRAWLMLGDLPQPIRMDHVDPTPNRFPSNGFQEFPLFSHDLTVVAEVCNSGEWQVTNLLSRGEPKKVNKFLYEDIQIKGGADTLALAEVAWQPQELCDPNLAPNQALLKSDNAIDVNYRGRPFFGEDVKLRVDPKMLSKQFRVVSFADSRPPFVFELRGLAISDKEVPLGTYQKGFRYRVEECGDQGKWASARLDGFDTSATWSSPKLKLHVEAQHACAGVIFQVATNYARAWVSVEGHDDQRYPVDELEVAIIYDGHFVPGDDNKPDTKDSFPYGSSIHKEKKNAEFVETSNQIRAVNIGVCSGFTAVATAKFQGAVTRSHVHS